MLNEQQIAIAIKRALLIYGISAYDCTVVFFSDVDGAMIETRTNDINLDIDLVYLTDCLQFGLKDYDYDMCYGAEFDLDAANSVQALASAVESAIQAHFDGLGVSVG